MSEALILGLIGAFATVGAPVIGYLLTWISEKRSQLLVTLTWHPSAKASWMDAYVKRLMLNSSDSSVIRSDERLKNMILLQKYFSAQSYLRFVIKNNSKKKLTNLSMTDNGVSSVYQLDDGEIISTEERTLIQLGDLLPGREIALHLWSMFPPSSWIMDSKKRFHFSADELDRVKIKEPMPAYVRNKLINTIWKFVLIGLIVFLLVIPATQFFKQI